MSLSARLHRFMAPLALVAMVLLLAVPTAGRIAQARSEAVAYRSPTAICTAGGLKLVEAAALLPVGLPAEPSEPERPLHPQHPDADCDYCPLLASTVVLALLSLLLHEVPGNTPPPLAVAGEPTTFLHPCGLGSRGPPVPL